jgi:transposase
MARRLRREEVMTIEVLAERGQSKRGIARQLGVDEKTVRYHLARRGEGDGRADKPFAAEVAKDAIAWWIERSHSEGCGLNLKALHEYLVCEHGYAGSYKSVQRYVRAKYPRPKLRSRRRVETPPGAQAQADWAEYRGVRLGCEEVVLYAFLLQLSYSRMSAVIWSLRKDLLAWLHVHNEALRYLGGVPAVIRVDNEKTAVSHGAGTWGTVHPGYQAYADSVRFHVDPCRPRCPGDKGKVEREVRDQRGVGDPRRRAWDDLEELQAHTDARLEQRARQRICPATGDSIWASYQEEKAHLAALPLLPEPFDLVRQRRVAIDATVRFEGRTYSVPFRYVDRVIEVRGCANVVQMWADQTIIAQHPRHTRAPLQIDLRHYEGPGDDRVEAPVPLGKMGRRLAEIQAMPPAQRPIDQYAALAEACR